MKDNVVTGHDFRMNLRDATRADHDALDTMISGLDIACPQGFLTFCRLHCACFTALNAQADPAGLPEMIAALQSDLSAMGQKATPDLPCLNTPIHPLAADYIIAGSIMGTKVLRRRWQTSSHVRVQSADAYFNLRQGPSNWPHVCEQLRKVVPTTSEAEQITTDTRRIFGLFQQTYLALTTTS